MPNALATLHVICMSRLAIMLWCERDQSSSSEKQYYQTTRRRRLGVRMACGAWGWGCSDELTTTAAQAPLV
ncbi:hypothetical protein BXZ70DRAFT_952389 [Cristinia sonorae]|uniref:Secreted protein n=1 Tax=Cristinia sonorae TaxID=1940300 RepID=A0A8K0XLW1_9AGAR|nr:hypothetical protein BXZ70DRAFT_952389 [Cristinia sonorae]